MSLSNAEIGDTVERQIRKYLNLLPYDGDEFDARTGTLTGTPVEIKATRPSYADGRTGRFQIGREQHDRLSDEGGLYVFAVYVVGTDDEVGVLDTVICSTDPIDGRIGGSYSWVSRDDRRASRDECKLVPVSAFPTLDDEHGGGRLD